jgi:hypothetical protein
MAPAVAIIAAGICQGPGINATTEAMAVMALTTLPKSALPKRAGGHEGAYAPACKVGR